MDAFKSIQQKLAAQALNEHLTEASQSISIASAIAIKAFGKNAPKALKSASRYLQIKHELNLDVIDEEEDNLDSNLSVIDKVDPVLSTCCIHSEPLQFWPQGVQKIPCNPTHAVLAADAACISASIRLQMHNFENLESTELIPNLKKKLLTKEKLQLSLYVKDDEDEDSEIKEIWSSFV